MKYLKKFETLDKDTFSLEDIEDLFMVNPDFEVDCLKTSYGFSILVQNVVYENVLEYSQRYWYEIPKRLPDNLELTKVNIEKISSEKYKFEIEIRKSRKLSL